MDEVLAESSEEVLLVFLINLFLCGLLHVEGEESVKEELVFNWIIAQVDVVSNWTDNRQQKEHGKDSIQMRKSETVRNVLRYIHELQRRVTDQLIDCIKWLC